MSRQSLLITIAILLYCIWNAADMFLAWYQVRLDKLDGIVFLIWLIPIFVYWYQKNAPYIHDNEITYTLGTALIISLIGVIGSLHILTHFAFALTLTVFIPWFWQKLIWIAASITWMPSMSWFGTHLFYEYLIFAKFFIAITSVIIVSYVLIKKNIRMHTS